MSNKTPESKKRLLLLSIAALGVVYGDIGTSPLYTINEIFFGHGQVALNATDILGSISLVFWALTLVVTLKYITFVLRAEYDGGGGVFALFGLLKGLSTRTITVITSVLILAAGFLLGDGMITPAISVLSAVEGLRVETQALSPYVIPITLIVLTALFMIQRKGTGSIGRVFGIIMSIWFAVIALLGLREIIVQPAILAALNPYYALHFIASIDLKHVMYLLGAVILSVTGGEALYADLGHFGVKPIRISWLGYVYPALLLCYFGQGAFLLSGSKIIDENVFYSMVPHMMLLPMVLLAMCATIIASQALISGAFSLIAQAIVQGVSPRFKIIHTSHHHEGQIYVPAVNWALYVGCVLLVITFRSATNLASAYGLAEAGVMITTSIAMLAIAITRWNWTPLKAFIIFGSFAVIDSAFLAANSIKFFEGGYVPFIVGLVLFSIMATWRWGRALVATAFSNYTEKRHIKWLVELKTRVEKSQGIIEDERGRMTETNRAVIFLMRVPIRDLEDRVPVATRLYIKRLGALPKCIILLNVSISKEAYLDANNYDIVDFGANIFAINAQFGFMDELNIRGFMKDLHDKKLIPYDVSRCTVQFAEEDLFIDPNVSWWTYIRARLFKLLSQFATPSYRYFGLGSDENLSVSLVPVHLKEKKAEVVQLQDIDLVI